MNRRQAQALNGPRSRPPKGYMSRPGRVGCVNRLSNTVCRVALRPSGSSLGGTGIFFDRPPPTNQMDWNIVSTYYPTLEQVRAMAGQGNLCPVYRSINADLETPVSAYLKVARPPYSFLLESVAGGERIGRYSFIGTEPYDVFSTGAGEPSGQVDPLTLVQREMDSFQLIPVDGLPPFHGGGVGYVAYDAVHYFEPRVPMPESDPQGLPESVFMFTDTLLVFDHLRHDIKVVSHARLDGGDIDAAYDSAVSKIERMVDRLSRPLEIPPELLATPTLARRRRNAIQLHRARIRGGD